MNFAVSVLAGVVAAAIGWLCRIAWERGRKSEFGARLMGRSEYLELVLRTSTEDTYESIRLLSPKLKPRDSNTKLAQLQDAWTDRATAVEVLTTNNDASIRAGLELESRGFEVRVLPAASIDDDTLSFHIFSTATKRRAITNEKAYPRSAERETVSVFGGQQITSLLMERFERSWQSGRSLTDILSSRVVEHAGTLERAGLEVSLGELSSSSIQLRPEQLFRLRARLGILNAAKSIVVTGLPGAGKTYARHAIETVLVSKGVPYFSSSDYGELYREFLEDQLVGKNGAFSLGPNGSFIVNQPDILERTFMRSFGNARDSAGAVGVTVFEFARPNMLGHLQRLDDRIAASLQLIYVEAPPPLRSARLAQRLTPPRIELTDPESVRLSLGSDYPVPDSAITSYYMSDDLDAVRRSAHWRDRLTVLSGDLPFSALQAEISAVLDRLTL